MEKRAIDKSNLRGFMAEILFSIAIIAYTYITQPDGYVLVMTIFGTFFVNMLFIDSYQNYKFYAVRRSRKSLLATLLKIGVVLYLMLVLFLTFLIYMITIQEALRVYSVERLSIDGRDLVFIVLAVGLSLILRLIDVFVNKKEAGDTEAHPAVVLISPLISLVIFTFVSFALLSTTENSVVIAAALQLVFILDYVFRKTNYLERVVNTINE